MHSNRKSILCTRPIDPELILKAGDKGIDISTIPFIQTILLSAAEIQQKIALPKRNATIVFTSANGVYGAASFLNRDTVYKIYCIAGATANAASETFGSSHIASTAEDAQALVSVILKDREVKEVYFFHGNRKLDTLPQLLSQNNINVHLCEVYKTEFTPQKISNAFDALVFFSPSAVESYLSENRISESNVIFTIGKTTAAKLSYVYNRVVISPAPSAEDMINTIINFYSNEEEN